MPIRKRISDVAYRKDVQRKANARHPLLRGGSRHGSVWETVKDHNSQGGVTSARLKGINGFFHPQIIKDLLDHKLIGVAKVVGNERYYVADPAGRGVDVQSVHIDVELFEDEAGNFHTRTKLHGERKQVGAIMRSLGKRSINFKIPMLHENVVQPMLNDVAIDTNSEDVKVPCRTDPKNVIIDM